MLFTRGQRADITQSHALTDGSATGVVAADKGYDADHFVEIIELAVAEAAIPPETSCTVYRPSDRTLYAERNLVERTINTIKHSRCFATGYDKLFADYRGFVLLAASAALLR